MRGRPSPGCGDSAACRARQPGHDGPLFARGGRTEGGGYRGSARIQFREWQGCREEGLQEIQGGAKLTEGLRPVPCSTSGMRILAALASCDGLDLIPSVSTAVSYTDGVKLAFPCHVAHGES